MNRARLCNLSIIIVFFSVLLTFLLIPHISNAIPTANIIDFENKAAPNTQTTHYDEFIPFGDFLVFAPHAHIEGVGFQQPAPRPAQNLLPGEDWFLHDHGWNGTNNDHDSRNKEFVVTHKNDLPFYISGFLASEWHQDFPMNTVIDVTGELANGGTIFTQFTTDSTFGFEKFYFDSSWTGLKSVSFVDIRTSFKKNDGPFIAQGRMGYDNLEVYVPTPEPTSMILFGIGLFGLALVVKRKI